LHCFEAEIQRRLSHSAVAYSENSSAKNLIEINVSSIAGKRKYGHLRYQSRGFSRGIGVLRMKPTLIYRVFAILLVIGVFSGPLAHAAMYQVAAARGLAGSPQIPHHGSHEAQCVDWPKSCPCTLQCSASLALAAFPLSLCIGNSVLVLLDTESSFVAGFQRIHRARAPPPHVPDR
jgi:hypothetical protein